MTTSPGWCVSERVTTRHVTPHTHTHTRQPLGWTAAFTVGVCRTAANCGYMGKLTVSKCVSKCMVSVAAKAPLQHCAPLHLHARTHARVCTISPRNDPAQQPKWRTEITLFSLFSSFCTRARVCMCCMILITPKVIRAVEGGGSLVHRRGNEGKLFHRAKAHSSLP